MKSKGTKFLLLIFLLVISILFYHDVPKNVSAEDKSSLAEIFGPSIINGEDLNFDEQILFVDRMVNVLHDNFIVGAPIAYNNPREPKQLIGNGGGLCYDFSRTIEKYLMLNGFKTRHVAVYLQAGGFWNTISSKGVYSHSLTEVLTKKGWIILDSNVKFYAIDQNDQVYSYKELKQEALTPKWKLPLDKDLIAFYSPKIVYVYGLYSRHGGFYKPYNAIPDYNIRELFYNF